MWAEIEKYLPMFESTVLNVRDSEGYPYSVRCRAEQDRSAGVLRLDLAAGEAIRPGLASLLSHSHDEEVWNQKIFILRGRLQGEEGGWVFMPEKFIPSLGTVGTRGMARFFFGVRKSAAAYLKKRNLPRPRIPWGEIGAVKEQAYAHDHSRSAVERRGWRSGRRVYYLGGKV